MCSRHHRAGQDGPFGFHGRFPWPLKVAGALVLVPGFLFLGAYAAYLLWNAVLPDLFGFPAVGYWQAMGILVLGRLIFGGRGGHPGRGFHPRRPKYRDRDEWREHLKQRFAENIAHREHRQHRDIPDKPVESQD